MTFVYATREEFKRIIKIPDPLDDFEIDTGLTTATTVIDMITGRRFQPYIATRTFDAPPDDDYYYSNNKLLLHADLLEVTTLKTDDGTRTYPNTWTSGTWDLGPEEAAFMNPPCAYWWIRRVPSLATSIYGWPCGMPGGIQIAGKWGVYDQHRSSGATVSGDIDAAVLTIPVSSGSPFEIGHSILIGSEQMYVTGKGATSLTVEGRGGNGTTGAAHTTGAAISIYTYPVITQACFKLSQRYLRSLKDAALGFVGGVDGMMRLAYNDPDVMGMLSPFMLTAMR